MNSYLSTEDVELGTVPGMQLSGQFSIAAEGDGLLETVAGLQPSGQFSASALPGLSQPMWIYADSDEPPASVDEEAANARGGPLFSSQLNIGTQNQRSGTQMGPSTTRARKGFARSIIQSSIVLAVLIGGLILAVGRVQSALGAQGNVQATASAQASPAISHSTSAPTSRSTGTPAPRPTSRPTPGHTPTPAPPVNASNTSASAAPLYSFEDGTLDDWSSEGHVSTLRNSQEISGQTGSHELEMVFYSTGNSDWPFIDVQPSHGPVAGQTLTAYVYVPSGSSATVRAKLFVADSTYTWHLENANGVTLSQGSWIKLSFRLSGYSGNAVQVGIQCIEAPFNTRVTLFVDSVSWS